MLAEMAVYFTSSSQLAYLRLRESDYHKVSWMCRLVSSPVFIAIVFFYWFRVHAGKLEEVTN